MKVLALNGSRRKRGNTALLIETMCAPLKDAGVEVEVVFLGDVAIEACTGCEGCSKSWECVIQDDYVQVVEKMDAADGVVLASPTYWYTVTSDMKRFVDRSYSLIQYPNSRQEWIGKYQGSGKACVTAAVCEQADEAMMGNTLTLLTDFAGDIGLDVVGSVKGLHFFEAGSVNNDPAFLQEVEATGERLRDLLKQ